MTDEFARDHSKAISCEEWGDPFHKTPGGEYVYLTSQLKVNNI